MDERIIPGEGRWRVVRASTGEVVNLDVAFRADGWGAVRESGGTSWARATAREAVLAMVNMGDIAEMRSPGEKLRGEVEAERDALVQAVGAGEGLSLADVIEAARGLRTIARNAMDTAERQTRLLEDKVTTEDAIVLIVMALLSDATNAPNYAEWSGTYLGRRYTTSVQWVEGKTPSELIREAQRERDEAHALTVRQGEILTGVANALRGAPEPLHTHSHHDLAERAAQVVAERDALTAAAREHFAAGAAVDNALAAVVASVKRGDSPDGQREASRAHTAAILRAQDARRALRALVTKEPSNA